MTFPKRILIALAAAAALLTACSSATDHSDMATLSEAVTTTNTLISDVVSVVSGFGSNPTIEEVAANYCS